MVASLDHHLLIQLASELPVGHQPLAGLVGPDRRSRPDLEDHPFIQPAQGKSVGSCPHCTQSGFLRRDFLHRHEGSHPQAAGTHCHEDV